MTIDWRQVRFSRNRPGRKNIAPAQRRRARSFRLTPRLDETLIDSARRTGRSISQEAEILLELGLRMPAIATPLGCVCPPTAEATCRGYACPRRPIGEPG